MVSTSKLINSAIFKLKYKLHHLKFLLLNVKKRLKYQELADIWLFITHFEISYFNA